jgi:hypothetical protein
MGRASPRKPAASAAAAILAPAGPLVAYAALHSIPITDNGNCQGLHCALPDFSLANFLSWKVTAAARARTFQ